MIDFRTFAFAAIVGSSALMFSPLPARADSMPSCAAGDQVVWENGSSKVYHVKGDKYFGNTKSGQYTCQSDAEKAGYHQSRSGSSKSKSNVGSSSSGSTPAPNATGSIAPKHHFHLFGSASPAPGASASPAATASGAPTSKHHHRHRGSASPAPDASSTPDTSASSASTTKHHRHKHASSTPSPAPSAT
jgi:hypothetical protein